MLGRRGTTNIMYEIIISLVMLGLFTATVWLYIAGHANGEAYIARFYAADLTTSAEVVNAGYGDVLLRYDNVKQNMQHTFWLQNGRIDVGKTGGTSLATGYYGKATRFDGDSEIISPNYLVLRKAGGFSINNAEKFNVACPTVADKKVPLEKVSLYIDNDDARKAAAVSLASITVTDQSDKANIRVTVKRQSGTENKIEFGPTSPDGASLACLFLQQLGSLSTIPFTANTPAQSAGDFALAITITTRQDVKLTDEQVGQAIGHALAVFYKGGQ